MNDNLPPTHIQSEETYLKNHFLRVLSQNGWQISSYNSVLPRQIATYRLDNYNAYLELKHSSQRIEVKGTITERKGNNVDIIYECTRVCSDLQEAESHIKFESSNLENIAKASYERAMHGVLIH